MSFSFICKGQGKPLLLLHGYLSCKESFIYQINYFSKFFKVYAPDLSGFGNNPPLKKPYALQDYVDDLLNFIKEQNLVNFNVIAHSFGVRLVLKSKKLQALADKLVFTGGAGLKPKRNLFYYYKIYKYKFLKRFFPQSKSIKKCGSKEYQLLSPIMQKSYVLVVNEHLNYTLKNITNKTLIINGAKDKTTPKYMAKQFKKGIKNCHLIFIKKAGHFAFIDKQNQFNLQVNKFLLE